MGRADVLTVPPDKAGDAVTLATSASEEPSAALATMGPEWVVAEPVTTVSAPALAFEHSGCVVLFLGNT